ncbi:hypothetical protein [Chryseolinea lacunae]|uniref:Gliding motility-associated protein GldM C-terminal domain-containing protein n=1 Tax=Chryseolinea lacunae TaxID=2801331 RepID=A0ABS1KYK8_9BACT|nr:hypothetical protein [Chryseolinea lacunae]MBL0744536.1 hypothetical protein [Chryseolinea lacunae]
MMKLCLRLTTTKIILSGVLVFSLCTTQAQIINGTYRTVREEHIKLHYLTFKTPGNCSLKFEGLNHGEAMAGVRYPSEILLHYKMVNDTITFSVVSMRNSPGPPTHKVINDTITFTPAKPPDLIVVKRLLAAKFVIREKNLYDCVSGLTYVDKNSISDKYMLYVLNGKHYKQRIDKVDGYGLVLKSHKVNREFQKDLSKQDLSKLTVRTLTGKKAFDKYGVLGMNGVYEVEKKK